MGFFDRSNANKGTPSNPAEPNGTATPPPGSVKAQLLAAREKLDAKDLEAAFSIYEELLLTSGDRPDVLVAMSGDLGSCGHVDQIVELIAPRYDAERHGPATGINLLQAYLATHNTEAAQHLLDILFGLKRPELTERLYGFSNALAELIEAERSGKLPPRAGSASSDDAPPEPRTIHLVTISRPIWSYGLESVVPDLLPPKEGRLRRLAFAQLSLPDLTDAVTRMAKPEDELGRLSRGLPLWLGETMYFSKNYTAPAAIGLSGKEHYGLFPTEWTTDNIRQLVDTTDGGLDYVFTGALRLSNGEYELTLRLWEAKKTRERKVFTARWTADTAVAELTKFQESVRTFMEWTPHPAGTGLTYTAPSDPLAWCHTLGTSLSFFLNEKGLLPTDQLATPAETLAGIAARAAHSEMDSLAWLSLRDRATRLGLAECLPPEVTLNETPLVLEAKRVLGL